MKTISPNKDAFPILFSLPLVQTLNLPARAELLPGIESGEIDHLDFTARVYGTGRNRNPYLFRDEDLASFAGSFESQPFLRNHDTSDIDARDGTILASRMDGGAFVQDIRLTTRRGMVDFLEGKIDRFSIGWFYDDVICTICNSSFFGPTCSHWAGKKYQTAEGEKTCYLLFVNPQGKETSAVNSPAVEGTDVIDARLQEFKLSLLESIPENIPDPQPENGGEELPAENAPVESQAADPGTDEAPLAQVRQASETRRLELAEFNVLKGAPIMNLRELMAQRAAKVDRAQELAALADAEERDFTDEERVEYQACLEEATTLGDKIEQVQKERAQLQDAQTLSAKLAETQAEKPAPGTVSKNLKRSEFDKLEALDQAAYVKAGGKVED